MASAYPGYAYAVPQQVTRLRVFVASPGDTREERGRLEVVIDELNRGMAAEQGIVLELVSWETHVRPGMGSDAQEVVNRQLPEADIVIVIFWKRLGTPTPRAGSGTVEEIQRAIEQWHSKGEIEIQAYFNQSPYSPRQTELEQLGRLLAFRATIESAGLLVWEYDGVPDFETKVRQHLTAAMREWPKRSESAAQTRSPENQAAWRSNRTATVLLELLANVHDHASSKDAVVKVEMRSGAVHCAVVSVTHRGRAFDLEGALEAGRRAYQDGDREHGLVKVARLSSGLRLASAVGGGVGLECFVFDAASISSGVFAEFSFVATASLELDVPKRWVFGRDVYVGREIENALRFALTEPAPRLLDLYFSGLRISEGTTSVSSLRET
jgi:hypothetical protein